MSVLMSEAASAARRGKVVEMIEVELRAVPQGKDDYEAIARLVVRDDGTHEEWDPQEVIPYDLHVLAPDEEAGARKVTFEEDPATWARHLKTILRTGYLVPVVVRDDAEPLEPGRA